MEEEEFRPEPLFARGVRICTWDKGINLSKVPYGPDCGLTEHEARSYAALLAQAPRMYALIETLATGLDCGFDSHLTSEAKAILRACEPAPKGRPFKRPPDTEVIQGGGEGDSIVAPNSDLCQEELDRLA